MSEIAEQVAQRDNQHKALAQYLLQRVPAGILPWVENTGIVESLLKNGRWWGKVRFIEGFINDPLREGREEDKASMAQLLPQLKAAWEEDVETTIHWSTSYAEVKFFPKVPA